MSFRHAILVRDSDLTGATKAVLLAIAMRIREDGSEAYPSVAQIVHDAGFGESTVRRIISSLENIGVLKVTRRPNTSSKYSIDMTKLEVQEREVQEGEVGGPGSGGQGSQSERSNQTVKQTLKPTPAGGPAGGTDVKAEDVLDTMGMGEDGPGPEISDKDMVDILAAREQTSKEAMAVWMEMYPRHHGYLPEFTRKQQGQFKQFMERAPDDKSLAIIGFSLRYWGGLTRKQKAPKKPHIGWLLAHVGDATDFMDEWLNKKAPAKAKKGQELVVGEL